LSRLQTDLIAVPLCAEPDRKTSGSGRNQGVMHRASPSSECLPRSRRRPDSVPKPQTHPSALPSLYPSTYLLASGANLEVCSQFDLAKATPFVRGLEFDSRGPAQELGSDSRVGYLGSGCSTSRRFSRFQAPPIGFQSLPRGGHLEPHFFFCWGWGVE
jgi:hypothetical protein